MTILHNTHLDQDRKYPIEKLPMHFPLIFLCKCFLVLSITLTVPSAVTEHFVSLTVANLILLKGCPAVTFDLLVNCNFCRFPLSGVKNRMARASHCKISVYWLLFFFSPSQVMLTLVLPVLQLPAACHAQCGAGAEAARLFPS